MQKNQSQGTKSHYGGTFSHRQVLYTSLYRLFKAQQIILYEISSIAALNNELCGRQGKWGVKRGCVHFDTPSCTTGPPASSVKVMFCGFIS